MRTYVGIDLHARTLQLCVVDAVKGERILERARVPNRLPAILDLLAPYRADTSVAVESTFNWYWLVDGLQDAGYEVHLGHTLGNSRISKAKVKTDRRDAFRLARLLRSGDLQEGYIYPRETRPVRDLIRARGKLVSSRSGEYGRIRMRLYRQGILEHTRASVRGMPDDDLVGLFDHPAVSAMVRHELARIALADAQIRKLEEQIHELSKAHPEVDLLRTLPGIDRALGPVIFFETGEISRFQTVKRYSSYCRLVPGCANSGSSSKPGRARKEGNPYLKSAFTQAATHAARTNDRIRRFAERHRRRRAGRGGKAVVRNIVAHKLCVAAWMMLTHGVDYEEEMLFGN
jgi:transposase